VFKIFLLSKSGWAYANLSKMAASYGGPQKLLNAVDNAGQVKGIVKVLVMEAGGLLGGAVAWGVMELPWWKREAKSEKHDSKISTNSYINCPECGTRFEHRSDLSESTEYLGCPNCNWGITDQKFEDGACEDGTFGDEL